MTSELGTNKLVKTRFWPWLESFVVRKSLKRFELFLPRSAEDGGDGDDTHVPSARSSAMLPHHAGALSRYLSLPVSLSLPLFVSRARAHSLLLVLSLYLALSLTQDWGQLYTDARVHPAGPSQLPGSTDLP